MRRASLPFVLLAVAVAGLAACDNDDAPPEDTVLVPEADVERLRIRLFEAAIPLDAALAAVEADAATTTDSTVRNAYVPILDRLRDDRHRLQARVDSLRPMPRAAFDSTAAAAERHVASLRAAIVRARLEATPNATALRAAVEADLARLDARLATAQARAGTDTTGRARAALDSLAADRFRLISRLNAYPDTSQAQFGPFRERAIRDALALRARADALAPDSTAVRFRRDAVPPRPAATPQTAPGGR